MGIAMSQRRYTLDDYLNVEEVGRVRHEYLDGQILAMAGGTPEHAALAAALLVQLGTNLRGSPCRVYSGDLRIRVLATGLYTYADAAIICGPIERDGTSPTHVTNPAVVFEVLSNSTEAYDRGEKREHYQRVASLREYVLVSQSARRVEVFARLTSDAWEHRVYDAGQVVELPSLGQTWPVNDLYDAAGVFIT